MRSSMRSWGGPILCLHLMLIAVLFCCSETVNADSLRYCAAHFQDATHITLFPSVGPAVTIPLTAELPATFQVIAFSPDGTAIYGQKSILLGPSDGIIKVEFRPTRSTQLRGSTEFAMIPFLTPSEPPGRFFVSSALRSHRGECGAYELDSGFGTVKALRVGMSPGCGGALGSVSPDGKRVLSYGDGRLGILDVDSGKVDQLGGGLTQGSWSPDGRWIAAWGAGKIVLIDANNASSRKHLGGSGFGQVHWSPDSKQLLIGVSQLSCAATLYGASLEFVDVTSGHRSLIKSSHCKVTSTNVGWIDREAVQ